MKKNYRQAFNALKKMGCPVIERPEGDRDGLFVISAEENVDRVWADYWEYSCGDDVVFLLFGGVRGVAQDICDVLHEHGLYAEWINPGIVGVYE